MTTFSELGLSERIVARLDQIGFTEPTEIQTKTIATILEGRDLMGSAETGSGKTAAYACPIIDLITSTNPSGRALILVPTRELALQVKVEFERFFPTRKLRTATIYGGTGYDKQLRELRNNPSVIVATPGRLLDLMDQRQVNLSNIQYLVLDEADRLMDLGFMPQVRKVVAQIPKTRQTVMFSATFDARVEKIAQEYLRNPVRAQVQKQRVEPITIDQKFHHTTESEKGGLLVNLVKAAGDGSILVFTRTRRKAKTVAKLLREADIHAKEIHGDISQNQRERTMDQYRKGQFPVLVATDIAARGLDVPAITHVVNYDLPQSAPDYVHRIGRTGRAGRAGCSHTFVLQSDAGTMRQIERVVGRTLCERPTPAAVPGSRPAARRGRFAPRLGSRAR